MDGFLLCDKPAGQTSHDVVATVRRTLGAGRARRDRPKVGHAGTLDPFATGLLVVLVGRATRVQRYVMALPKSSWSLLIRFMICACVVTSSAVVGSSAISRSGLLISAIAIITRWRMPPENWCG